MKSDVAAVRVPMRTGTHGDVLAAVGMADLLRQAFTGSVRLEAVEGAFLLRTPEPISLQVLARIARWPGYRYMRPNDRTAFPDEVPEADRLDYPAVSREEQRRREESKRLRKELEKCRK